MESEEKIKQLHNEIFRKVGRNILLFQQFELLIKDLMIIGSWEGKSDKLFSEIKNKKDVFKFRSLGQCIGELAKNNKTAMAHFNDSKPVVREQIRFSMSLETDGVDFFEAKTKKYEELLNSRNNLVHHFRQQFKLMSIEGFNKAEKYLDEQREELLPEHDELLEMVKACREGVNKLFNSE